MDKSLDKFLIFAGSVLMFVAFFSSFGFNEVSEEMVSTVPLAIIGGVLFLSGYIGYNLKVSK